MDEPVDILVADDDATSRLMLAGILRKQGYRVAEARDGGELLGRWEKLEGPALIILDWMMPVMDGLQVIRKIRAEEGDLASFILMLTSRSGKDQVVEGLSVGANDYLVKPCDAAELTARVGVGMRMLRLQHTLSEQAEALRQALEQIRTLHGIIPICASCKRIRNDSGYWEQVEVYVREHTEAEFSHGLCPDCMTRYYPEALEEEDPAAGDSGSGAGAPPD